jgi:hypothetical protein
MDRDLPINHNCSAALIWPASTVFSFRLSLPAKAAVQAAAGITSSLRARYTEAAAASVSHQFPSISTHARALVAAAKRDVRLLRKMDRAFVGPRKDEYPWNWTPSPLFRRGAVHHRFKPTS